MSTDVAFGQDRVLGGEVVAWLRECLGDGVHDPPTEHHTIERRDLIEVPSEDDAFLVQGVRITKSDFGAIHGS